MNTAYTLEGCKTTSKASVTLNTSNAGANYVAGIIGLCNDGLQTSTNNGTVNVKLTAKNTSTQILHIGGVGGRQVRTMSDCHNTGAINIDMASSTNPIYAGTILGDNYAATSVISGCSNSGNMTVVNAGHTSNIGQIVGYGPAGHTVTDSTSTGTVTVNGTAL